MKVSLEEETQRHHRLAEKWDSLVEQIRLLPDFGDFLLPKNVSVLKKAADSGPVVVINIHHTCYDALVLEQGRNEVHHIPLENLCYEDVEKMQKFLRNDLAGGTHRACGLACPVECSGLETVLSDLYSKVVYPILQGLGLVVRVSRCGKICSLTPTLDKKIRLFGTSSHLVVSNQHPRVPSTACRQSGNCRRER